MKTLWTVVLAVLLLAGLSVAGSDAGGKERQIGLSAASVFDTTVAPAAPANERSPGDGELLPRAYPGAPPVIPHAIGDMLPITWDDNACITCHADPDMGAPLLPESHRRDLRNAPDRVAKQAVGARYACVLCHAAATGAAPLVGNRFTEGEGSPAP